MTDKRHYCEDCGQRLVHLKRKPGESASEMGQFIMDELPRTFSWTDIDGVIFRYDVGDGSTLPMLRVCEHKPRNTELRPSQKQILPLIAIGVDYLRRQHIVHDQSGVFVVYSDNISAGAVIEPILPTKWYRPKTPRITLSGDAWLAFVMGRAIGVGNAGIQ